MVAAHPHPFEAEIPAVLKDSVERHQLHLSRLLGSLRASGMAEAEVEAAVTVVIDSYKHELLQAIRALMAVDHTDEDGR